ncbi:hypothetical protein AMATHDRAFT_6070 [Amanita thiersii Skay4041]|uniref:Uncharacterized protein n=1 Tax=Amanita thiersii Skay4041 TaxID=703135 RepID=A0A2A9NC28_9AGAR|nr:hypothetical protein AMATHDRAFT_6070 [Amanita thiersii Skay4041]
MSTGAQALAQIFYHAARSIGPRNPDYESSLQGAGVKWNPKATRRSSRLGM